MNTTRWTRAQAIFNDVIDLEDSQKVAAIEEHCRDDDSLKQDVMALLKEDAETHPLLDASLPDLAEAALRQSHLRTLVDREMGAYRLLRLLGEGGMGVVYLAERIDIGGLVAIKFLLNAWMSPMRQERFALERQMLARLNHPHIARIYDAGALADGTPFFVMEYADGLPITTWLSKQKPDIKSALRLFRQVCEAVQYAHRHAIVHRDLKPTNILVTSEGEIKLLDFGIAKDLTSTYNGRTVDGLRLLTPAYAAPEQIEGGTIGTFTDVYALGSLLHEILTGVLPQSSNERNRDKPLPRPSHLLHSRSDPARSQLTRSEWGDLDVLCLTALELAPEQRYPSVDALIHDLDAFLEGKPLNARGHRFSYLCDKFVRQHRSVLLSVGAALLILVAAVLFFTIRLARARDQAIAEAARTARLQQYTEHLFDGGDPSAGAARDLTATALLKRGEIEVEGLYSDPRIQADMLSTLGGAYQRLGQLGSADALLTRALQLRAHVFGKRDRQYLDSLTALGLLRKDQGHFGEAESLLRQALALDRQILAPHDASFGHGLWALSSVLAALGKYGESRRLAEEAVTQDSGAQGHPAQLADDLAQLGDIHFYLGDYAGSGALERQALEIDRKLFGDHHPAVGRLLDTLGQIDERRGHLADSEREFRQALTIYRHWYGSDHPSVADELVSLAKVTTGASRYSEARGLLNQALAIQQKVYGRVHSRVALTFNELGILAFNADRYEEAETNFRQALTIWAQVYGARHRFVGLAYANLTSIYMHRRQYKEAEQAARTALDIYRTAIPPKHPDFAILRVKLGRILLREGRFGEAERESLQGYRYFSNHEGFVSYLSGARSDLIQIEAKLGRPQMAQTLLATDQKLSSSLKH